MICEGDPGVIAKSCMSIGSLLGVMSCFLIWAVNRVLCHNTANDEKIEFSNNYVARIAKLINQIYFTSEPSQPSYPHSYQSHHSTHGAAVALQFDGTCGAWRAVQRVFGESASRLWAKFSRRGSECADQSRPGFRTQQPDERGRTVVQFRSLA